MSETLKIVLGYVIFFLYMGLVMFLGELLKKKTKLDEDMCRKISHVATGLSWLICYFLTGLSIHTVIINLVGTVALAIVMFGGLLKSAQRSDSATSYGLLFFGISTLVVMAIAYFTNNEKFYLFTGIAYYCMVLGDGLAPIVARLVGKFNFKVTEKKSFAGMITVFLFSCLSAWIFSAIFDLGLSALFIISVGALSAITELFSEKCTDNLTVVFVVFGYLVLNYFELAPLSVQWVTVICFPLIIFDGATKALTPVANLVSFILLWVCTYFAGVPMFVGITGMFVLAAVISKITNHIYNKTHEGKKHTTRKAVQIVANSAVAIASCIVYYFAKIDLFLWVGFAVIAEEFADTVASDVGKLSRRNPRNIIGFAPMTPGISGGVSVIGTVGALIGSAVALVVPIAFGVFDWKVYLVLTAIAFVGTLIDSLLGSGLQVLYRCSVCETYTERKVHCEQDTSYVKGLKFVDNSCVNFLSGLLTAVISGLVLMLF